MDIEEFVEAIRAIREGKTVDFGERQLPLHIRFIHWRDGRLVLASNSGGLVVVPEEVLRLIIASLCVIEIWTPRPLDEDLSTSN